MSLRAYQRVVSAHEALTERLRFLSPLKLSGVQSKEQILGRDIEADLRTFFGEDLQRENINLEVSDSFRRFKIFDRRSRIIPVFLNLANNSRYWLAHSTPPGGRILIDVQDGNVIFADDGPGVEPGDVRYLFTLYFTRRSRGGRGVGLYLCRANLAAGGHQIWYGTEAVDRLLKGANFVMRFMGGADDIRRNN
jgi:signal transduction histidine kinase